MPARNMSAMQLFGIKRQFLPTCDIFATPRLAVRSLDVVRAPNLNLLLFKNPPRPHCHQRSKVGWVFRQVFLHHPTAPFGFFSAAEGLSLTEASTAAGSPAIGWLA